MQEAGRSSIAKYFGASRGELRNTESCDERTGKV